MGMQLDEPWVPDADAAERFARDGHVTLAGLVDPQVLAALEPELTAAVDSRRRAAAPWNERSTYDRAFVQVMNLWRTSPAARSLVQAPRVVSAAAALIGVASLRIYHDQALYKEPAEADRGGHTPWHVDQHYWPLASDRAITAWIPLGDVPDEMGPLTFASGSQSLRAGRELAISDDSERAASEALAAAGYRTFREPFAAGDVSFHLGWTWHGAPPNRSESVRKVMTCIYLDGEMRVAAPANPNQERDLATWFPGLVPGDLAATPINPQVWPPT